jgi:hypothetical protein
MAQGRDALLIGSQHNPATSDNWAPSARTTSARRS